MSLNKGLGKGLGALFSDVPAGRPGNSGTEEAPRSLPLADIIPNAEQPRKNFNDESLRELAESIRRQGILQPLLVRPLGNGYQLVAGERRWRAAKLAGLGKVPVVIRVMDDRDVMVAALIENLQRIRVEFPNIQFAYLYLVGQKRKLPGNGKIAVHQNPCFLFLLQYIV